MTLTKPYITKEKKEEEYKQRVSPIFKETPTEKGKAVIGLLYYSSIKNICLANYPLSNYGIQISKNLTTSEYLENVVIEVKKLQFEIKELKNDIDILVKIAGNKDKSAEGKFYIYFETREEGMRVIQYCHENKIRIRPEAPGTLRIFSNSDLEELKIAGFKFNTTENIMEIYNNKEFLKSHKKQVEDFYEL
jgi:hypothetical protein